MRDTVARDEREVCFPVYAYRQQRATGGQTPGRLPVRLSRATRQRLKWFDCWTGGGIGWHISDPKAAYLNPGRTPALTAVDLLRGEAQGARQILESWTPPMAKAECLAFQQGIAAHRCSRPAAAHLACRPRARNSLSPLGRRASRSQSWPACWRWPSRLNMSSVMRSRS